jgi:hypothetical protein
MNTSKSKRTKATRAAAAAADAFEQAFAPKSASRSRGQIVAAAPSRQVTEIRAKMDVGWGNALFLRGQGDGLSWEKGTPLDCVDGSTWIWATQRAGDKIVCKLLLNDQVWAAGTDLIVEPGKRVEVVPVFQGSPS